MDCSWSFPRGSGPVFVFEMGSVCFPSVFPAATFLINSTGAFLLGYLLGHSASDSLRLWIGTGFMGAFTTFSTLKMESVKLLDQKRIGIWLLYTGATYSVGLALAYAGFIL
ncbi:CrcB-like protein [Paenibacillus larvae subsp. larvae]|nr:CrcB-like protein [Paenibacillus larvae subsp. larvae]ETK25665.1 CrcB-like protein [Paenibacillus larvae subsp. larvae DSM 25719]